jgi:SAM-dependent methyltransferase
MGRDALNFVRHSEAVVFAVDTSLAALSTATLETDDARIAFVQADIANLPFADEFFDFISCDQVIHHTPDPQATFEHLRRKLKTGGHLCCYVYRKKSPIREFTDDYVRDRIKHLPADEAMASCEAITRLGRALAGLRATVEVEQDIPLLGIPKGTHDVQRLFHWHVMKCFWNESFDFLTNNIVNFDWYHPEYCFRFTPEEFRAWFETGWEIETWDVQEAGISCRARKV